MDVQVFPPRAATAIRGVQFLLKNKTVAHTCAAASGGYTEILKILILNKADVNTTDQAKNLALVAISALKFATPIHTHAHQPIV